MAEGAINPKEEEEGFQQDDNNNSSQNLSVGNEGGDNNTNNFDHDDNDEDTRKVFVSRIPSTFNEDSLYRIFREKFGSDSVVNVSILYQHDDEDDGGREGDRSQEGEQGVEAPMPIVVGGGDDSDWTGKQKHGGKERKSSDQDQQRQDDGHDRPHRGFAFVTFDTPQRRDGAIEAGTVRGKARVTSKRKYTMYIRPVVRDPVNGGEAQSVQKGGVEKCVGGGKNVCFLWSKFRCPYGIECKFVHEGEGGCLSQSTSDGMETNKKKRQKCFAFKKKGKCKAGDACPFSHEFGAKKGPSAGGEGCENRESSSDATASGTGDAVKEEAESKGQGAAPSKKSDKDCINWKTKGKCRKRNKCPYRHDDAVRVAALEKLDRKKKRKLNQNDDTNEIVDKTAERKKRNNTKDEQKTRQPLSIRVFGLNYDTTEEDVRAYFDHCGPIVELTFPTFDDSGRSKGYCGLLFQSPKAVAKAVELDGSELHGRWISVQAGKMYLRQWEENLAKKKKEQDGQMRMDEESVSKFSAGPSEGVGASSQAEKPVVLGEFGQKVKRRKRHGYKE